MTGRKPTIVVPFSNSCSDEACQDIFLYLRPESNGIKVESAIMRGLSGNAEYRESIKLVYLANLPGSFLVQKGVVKSHYKPRYIFARLGGKIFTPYMKRRFSEHYGVEFAGSRVIGAYEALLYLQSTEDELFNAWVPVEDMLIVDGQVIKKIGDVYVVNSDIPAILHKNNNKTDIAVMIFRTHYTGEEFYQVIQDITGLLVDEGILHSKSMFSRVFHYSKGPFEQILDAVGFLYNEKGEHLPLENIRFYKYLVDRGIAPESIKQTLTNPIFLFDTEGREEEDSIFVKTKSMEYSESLGTINRAKAQIFLDIYDRL